MLETVGHQKGAGLRGVFCVCCDLNASLSAHMPAIGRRTFMAVAAGAAIGMAGASAANAAGKVAAKAPVTVYTAKKIITMERAAPVAEAIAVEGGRIVAVGSLGQVKAALGGRTFSVDETFAGKVLMPGADRTASTSDFGCALDQERDHRERRVGAAGSCREGGDDG